MHTTLPELVEAVRNNRGTRKGGRLAYEIKMLLWQTYDPNDELIYPVIDDWDSLLQLTIDNSGYGLLSREEVLSILFGLLHRNRIVEGMWWSMFERGVAQRLLAQLIAVDSERYN